MNPNRSLDTPSPFLIGKVRLSGILPASVRILILASWRRVEILLDKYLNTQCLLLIFILLYCFCFWGCL